MSFFSENLKELSKALNISVRGLSRLCGVPQPTLSRAINGVTEPRPSVVMAVAKAFDLDPWLLQSRSIIEFCPNLYGRSESELSNPNVKPIAAPTGRPQRTVAYVEVTGFSSITSEDKDFTSLETELSVQVPYGMGTKCDGAVAAMMPTDDLLPRITRGDTIYVARVCTDEAKRLPKDALLIGLKGDELYFGTLKVVGQKIRMVSTDVNFQINEEIDEVIGHIIGFSSVLP